MIKHIFFDLDHTLWDFKSNSRATLEELFEAYGLGSIIPSKLSFISHYEHYNDWCWEQYRNNRMRKDYLRHQRFFLTLRDFGMLNRSLAKKLGTAFVDRAPWQTRLIPGCQELLEALAPNYPMSIITNGFEEVQLIKLKEGGIFPYFKHIITSERAGCRKPHAGIYKLAMKLSACKAQECLMVGDTLQIDIEGALRMHWQAVWFQPEPTQQELPPNVNRIAQLNELLPILQAEPPGHSI